MVTRLAPGAFLVTVGDRRHVVYVAGPPSDRWAFWNGEVFRSAGDEREHSHGLAGARGESRPILTAPMPATVIKVLVTEGTHIRKGESLVVLEAMKMELPVRALAEGTVTAVRCREGDLVQASQPLVEMEEGG